MKVRELLSSERRWTKWKIDVRPDPTPCRPWRIKDFGGALNRRGRSVSPWSKHAEYFDLRSAILRCYGRPKTNTRRVPEFVRVESAVDQEVGRQLPGYCMTWWESEPGRTFDDVRRIIEKLDI